MEETAVVGVRIELELVDNRGEVDRMVVQIVEDAFADLARGYLGAGTPLCQAIYGRPAGAEIAYPVGDLSKVRILSLTPTADGPDRGVAARRETTLRKAVDDSERTNVILFASSFNGKWGDYDPSGLIDEADKAAGADTDPHPEKD